MQLGMIGLRRMGANMVRRLIGGGHQCAVFDMSPKAVDALNPHRRPGQSGAEHKSTTSLRGCGRPHDMT